jgi:hypothetical protein
MFFKRANSRTPAWVLFLFRWRFNTALVAVSASAEALGCEAEHPSLESQSFEKLAQDELVIADLAARSSLSTQEAALRAREIAFLAKINLEKNEALQPDQGRLDDAQILASLDHLRRKRAIELWLTHHFEARHTQHDIERTIIEQNLAEPNVRNRIIHPKLHFICQLIVEPRPEHPVDVLNDLKWQERAQTWIAPTERILQANLEELQQESDCQMFFALVKLQGAVHPDQTMQSRPEQIVLEIDRSDLWVPQFIAAVSPQSTPGIVSPFFTKFGLHLVHVRQVLAANLQDGSMPAQALEEARRTAIAEAILPAWRRSKFGDILARLRQETPIRTSPDLSHLAAQP